jgi:hypothetical protein
MVPSLRRVVSRAFFGTTNPSVSLPAPRDFGLPAVDPQFLPDSAAAEGLSCSTILFENVPPPATPERSSIPPGFPECCLLRSPWNERLGPSKNTFRLKI